MDFESGLVYFNFRYYNYKNAVWIDRDFIFKKNLYNYCLNNSILVYDYLGLSDVIIIGGVADKGSIHDVKPTNFYLAAIEGFHVLRTTKEKNATVLTFYFKERYTHRKDWPNMENDFKGFGVYRNCKVFEYNSAQNLIDIIKKEVAKTKDKKICRLVYYGHGNPNTLLLDYNEHNGTGGDKNNLYVDDLVKLSDLFSDNMFFVNAGCNGKEFSKDFTKRTNKTSYGSEGSVDYAKRKPKSPLPPSNVNYYRFDKNNKEGTIVKDKDILKLPK